MCWEGVYVILVKEIEKKRKQLVEIVKKHGLTSTQSLQCSQELDRLIETYQHNRYNENKRKPSEIL